MKISRAGLLPFVRARSSRALAACVPGRSRGAEGIKSDQDLPAPTETTESPKSERIFGRFLHPRSSGSENSSCVAVPTTKLVIFDSALSRLGSAW